MKSKFIIVGLFVLMLFGQASLNVNASSLEKDVPVTESIIGEDNRVKITNTTKSPYKYIGKLYIYKKNGQIFIGTGFLIGKSTVLTAGHCAYDYENPVTKIVFHPGKNGTINPFGSYKVSKIYVKSQYKKARKNNDEVNAEKYDYAILKLEKGMDSNYGYFKIGGYNTSYNSKNMQGKKAALTGYPGEKNSTMYRHVAKITSFDKNGYSMYYKMDSTGGQSGSPIYKANNGNYYVIGIHTRGSSSRNIGRYIDKEVYDFINKYK